MIKQVQLFLGPARARAFVLLLGITGLASLILNAFVDQGNWVRPVQTLLVIGFLIGAAVIFGGRMRREERIRWAGILAPSIGAIILALTVLPQYSMPLLGGAIGWIIAGIFLFRQRVPREFQSAVKHLHKGEYEEAVSAMDAAIKDDPDNESYYRFRAEVFRLWGKLDRARKDYVRMTELAPESAVAYNGLAEVQLQAGKFDDARQAALKAYELAPEEWVAAYNLGMIEDRLRDSQSAIEHLQHAVTLHVPDVRHRLLIHLYLARAFSRLGNAEAVQTELANIKRYRTGLEEWRKLAGTR
jgi:tetratricopeptide (TPR) repeat protein